MQVIDVTDPASLTIVGSIDTHYAHGVVVSDNCAYVADGSMGLKILPAQCERTTVTACDYGGSSPPTLRVLPNPSLHHTVIRLQNPDRGLVQANVYDITARLVRRLFDDIFNAGVHDLLWDRRSEDGRPVAAGVYLVRVSTTEGLTTARIVVVR